MNSLCGVTVVGANKCQRKKRFAVALDPVGNSTQHFLVVTSRFVLECVARRRKLDLWGMEIPAVIPNNTIRAAGYRQYIAWRYKLSRPAESPYSSIMRDMGNTLQLPIS